MKDSARKAMWARQTNPRGVSKDIAGNFIAGNKRSISNSMTDGDSLFLHGNKIAWKEPDGIVITTAGWNTKTTKDRLNALPNVSVKTIKGQLMLNDKEWDGSPIKVN